MRINIKLLSFLLLYFYCLSPSVVANVTQIPGAIRDQINDRADTTSSLILRTKKGPFEIRLHFNKRHHHFVYRVIEILKADAPALIDYFDHAPEVPLHILVNGAVNQSNGSATSFPKLLINLYDYPPAGSEHLSISGDWLRNLVVHELVHVLHHSQIYGVNKVINYLFGAGRLMPMIVPRWFSEGIAVWAETKFSTSGRLRNPMYRWETNRTFLIDDFCDGAGCIDMPGKYPYRQFPYWAGAYFMDDLEKDRPGSIKCLVRENAANVPFFLNSAFENCLNQNAEMSYRVFHVDYQDRVKEGIKQLKKSKKTLNYSFINFGQNQISLQSGFELIGDKMVFAQNLNRDPRLMSFELNSRAQSFLETQDVLSRIEQMNGKLQIGTVYFRGDVPLKFHQVTLNEGQAGQSEINTIKTNDSYIYTFKVGKVRYGLKYAHMHWRLYEVLPKNKKRKDRQIHIFPDYLQLYAPQVIDGKLIIFAYDTHTERYQLFHWEKGILHNLVQELGKGEIFYDQFRCENNLYLRSDKFLYRYFNNQFYRSSQSILKDIAYQRVSNSYEVNLFKDDSRGFYYRPSNCTQFNNEYAFEPLAALSQKPPKNLSQEELNQSLEKIKLPNLANYYPLTNLSIDYWLLAVNFDRALFNTSLESAFTDPATNLTFGLRGIRYWELQENGYDIGTSYLINNNWAVGANASKFYFSAGFNNEDSFSETQSMGLSYFKFLGRYSYTASLFGAMGNERDFISARESKQVGIMQGISKGPKKYNEFVPRLNLFMSHGYQNTLNRSEFLSHTYMIDFSLKYSPLLQQHFYSTYSRMFKSDYGSGVMYAGRYNQVEVLGIPTNDLFGNEIMTARTQFDYLLDQFFRKDSLFPWYTREIHLLAGAEWFKADFGLLNDRFFGRNDWVSAHAGVRLQANVAYLLPIDFDILYTSTMDPGDEVFNELIFTIKATWWP